MLVAQSIFGLLTLSFDLFVGCFRNGQEATFRRELVERHFGRFVHRREPGCLTLQFDADQSYLFCSDEESIAGFNINRPAVAHDLCAALLAILRDENLVLYVPGECPPLLGRMEVAAHLPADMVESLGAPIELASPEDILERVAQA